MSTLPIRTIAPNRLLTKRDGRVVQWDTQRVIRAVALSFYDIRYGTDNPHHEDIQKYFGLDIQDYSKTVNIARRVENIVDAKYHRQGIAPNIEQVQDVVELAIMTEGEFDVAKNYMLYRARRNETRLAHYDNTLLSNYVTTSKYMRYVPSLRRRETLNEAVDRVLDMHLSQLALDDSSLDETQLYLQSELLHAFNLVRDLKVWPSSRSMQFGGRSIEIHKARLFNCTYSPITRIEFFREYMYLLLCGCGCGFSVQWHHIDQLPEFPIRPDKIDLGDLPVKHHVVADTIIGWADAVHDLFMSFLEGYYVEFAFDKIRPKGAPLRTSGGKAPGHLPLKNALQEIETILSQSSGRRLKPIEAYDICMHIAQSVLSGGVRRSATICLFSPDDGEMMTAKNAQNYNVKKGINSQRSASNNSAAIVRETARRDVFDRLFNTMLDKGEPGFYFVEDPEHGTNPCVEIGLHPRICVDFTNADQLRTLMKEYEILWGPMTLNGQPMEEIEPGDVLYGWQFCNLTTINGAKIQSEKDFIETCHASAVIGTVQASYTEVPYLGPLTQFINDREALLGVSITGIMDSPQILLNPEILRRGAEEVKLVNQKIAAMIGIRPAARTTCIKPEGTAAKVLGAASGVGPHYARRYFRRMQEVRTSALLKYFKSINPNMVERSVYGLGTDDVIKFPIEAPKDAIVRSDLGATQFLECVHLVIENWIKPGMAYDEFSPGLHHNVSNTVEFNSRDAKNVSEWIWNHRNEITGIALLVDPGVYQQAPQEEVESEKQIEDWNSLGCKPVDFTQVDEDDDNTSLKETIACAGGLCEV